MIPEICPFMGYDLMQAWVCECFFSDFIFTDVINASLLAT